ncbi:hypothetical protein SPBR_06840 [Sporothrix brasiliensis 5110]|uniref:Vanillate O-demethylase oxidoreductase n=1 Tax=Sporothrix brasiliensis 5110 TaxID=1398154 RepID=A0A0C2IU87_9PEZI|nr:uncharacterized protein SPBR_06840 [Sporothrix brasiliensis 5110]KIH88572.1 hypothetical protein SPBR_06840 [Sporothrix brasiliensis 5110]
MGETTRAPESPLSGGTQSGVSADPSQGNTSTNPAATPSAPVLDLYEPITSDVILEVRSGKMKALEGLKITSAIDKDLCTGRVKREFPAAAARFRSGGFGENLVFAHLNERNIHIGDVFAVGPKINGKTHTGLSNEDLQGDCLLLQVSLPRQPCFKLNHRFGLRNFAPNTWKTSRTGWYYRVLRPGTVQAGDEVRLVRRPNPAWPLERVQEYLHRSPNEMAMVEELAAIDEFGAECKNQFKSRLAKHEAQQRKKARLAEGGDGKPDDKWLPFRVVEKTKQTPRIVSFVFEAVDPPKPDAEPNDDELDPGSHVRLRLGGDGDGGDQKDGGLVRSYSIVKGNKRRFELGIAYDAATSRGGSRFLHEAVSVGSIVHASAFAAGVPIVSAASHHVYVAGGVGITAFLAHLESLTSINYSCVLHYAVRSAEEVAFAERLKALGPDVVIVYDASKGQRMDIASIVSSLPWNAHISFCGPTRMMDAALEATRASSLSDSDVHFEAFSADTTGDPFDVVVRKAEDASNGDNANGDAGGARAKTLRVGEDETLLEVLQREFGVDAVASSCEVGNCATCKVTVRAGRIDHRGTALTSEEKAAGNSMLSCVSRGIGRVEIEI